MGQNSESVKTWRKNTKTRIVQAMGGCCQICGYDRCYDSLDLHHINPEEKEFGIGGIRANPKKWKIIAKECKKCILLCKNCHTELHNGITKMPENFQAFDETLITFTIKEKTYCPVCKKLKKNYNKTCSLNCAAKLSRTVDWDSVDLENLLKTCNNNFSEVGRRLNVSGNAVKKRAKKIGLV